MAETTPENYLEQLKQEALKGVMLGHHDDTLVGRYWIDSTQIGRSDFHDIIGAYPKVMEFDLMNIENGPNTAYTDDISRAAQRKEIIKQHNRGGYIVFSWHMKNPYTGKGASSTDSGANGEVMSDTVNKILTDTAVQKVFNGYLDNAVTYLKTLVDYQGNQIPIMLRPFHEVSNYIGFWWDRGNCSSDDYNKLWQYTYNYLKNRIDNILFIYSYGAWSYIDTTSLGYGTFTLGTDYYPGDNYIDILGYERYYDFNFNDQISYQFNKAIDFAVKHNKLLAITEAGFNPFLTYNIDTDLWAEGYSEINKIVKCKWTDSYRYNILYIGIWYNAYLGKDTQICFGPYPAMKEIDYTYAEANYNSIINGKTISDFPADISVDSFIEFCNSGDYDIITLK